MHMLCTAHGRHHSRKRKFLIVPGLSDDLFWAACFDLWLVHARTGKDILATVPRYFSDALPDFIDF